MIHTFPPGANLHRPHDLFEKIQALTGHRGTIGVETSTAGTMFTILLPFTAEKMAGGTNR